MLETNECLEKLAAARVDFTAHGMLEGTALSEALEAMLEHAEEDLAEVEDERGLTMTTLTNTIMVCVHQMGNIKLDNTSKKTVLTMRTSKSTVHLTDHMWMCLWFLRIVQACLISLLNEI